MPFANSSQPVLRASDARAGHASGVTLRPAPSRDPGFGIYVHWPFCLSKCPYCDFNSHVRGSIDHDRWRAAYKREIASAAARTGKPTVTSIFFGGGTPSLMESATVATVLDGIAASFTLAPDVEITLEANPTSAESARFRDYRAAGVNRLSLGMQALDDASLKFLGREHSTAQARAALAAGSAVFDRTSFDLIYVRPGQSIADWRRELTEALGFGTDHLSVYQLTIEEGTRFYDKALEGNLVVPDEDVQADLYDITQELCDAAGLPAYEISNHARAGSECRHNLTYWRSGDWVGIGPGAHGRLTQAGGRVATRAIRSPEGWLSAVETAGSGAEPDEALDSDAALRERVLMGLRLSEGLDATAFQRAVGFPVQQVFAPALDGLVADGFVIWDGDTVRATERGRLVLNRVIATLLGD
ncbi:MAG: coproporphyrinogen III oxidase [Alphaproteobacteria bacterium]|nr:coproporphyrinogen III oxidase [Alphaproteobacteria bacterium]